MNDNFESLGEHLRKLLAPYITQIQQIEELHKAELEGNTEKFNEIKQILYNTPTDNLNDINLFSFTEPMEKINYKTTKLYQMEQMIKQQ